MHKYRYVLLLIVITALCYFNSLNSGFVWDDINNVVNNVKLDARQGLREIFLSPWSGFYRPLSYLSIKLDYWIWGKNPFGYHLTNVFFHLLNVIIIFYLVKRLTSSEKISFFSALFFAVHPIHTEAVAYISGRSDPIYAFFLFFSFYLYLKAVDRSRFWSPGSLFLFILGLLSRETALVFPVLIFSYNLCFLKCSFNEKFKHSIPYFALAIGFLLFRGIFVEGALVGIQLGTFNNIFKILLFYIGILVFPFNLHMQHNLSENAFLFNMPFLLSALIVVGLIAAILRIKRRYVKFALSWFIITLLPFAGVLKLDTQIAEHWTYFASFGFFLLIVSFLSESRLVMSKVIWVALACILSILTVRSNTIWKDDVSLYVYTLRYHPDNYELHYNLGNAYLRRDMLKEAKKEYARSLELEPDYAYALNNLGLALEKQGNLQEAKRLYKQASILSPRLEVARENIFRLQFESVAYAQESSFDHSLFAQVLSKYIENGRVNYSSLVRDRKDLYLYLRKIAELDPDVFESMSEDEKLAFYINAYNALTLKAVVEHYPIKGIKEIPGVWDKLKFTIYQREVTLNDIEHGILRKEFKEPRIHFALNCASIGCPELPVEPFIASRLDEQLDIEARKFINDKSRVRLDRKSNIFYISSIFRWFGKDFGDFIGFISKYLPEKDALYIRMRRPTIKYLQYDWSLNDRGRDS